MKTNFANGHLRSFVERIIRLKQEQDTLGTDIREIYKEASATGFDKTVIGQVVTHLRKIDKNGAGHMEEATAMFDLYLQAYEGRDGTEVALRAPAPKAFAAVA